MLDFKLKNETYSRIRWSLDSKKNPEQHALMVLKIKQKVLILHRYKK